MIETKEYLTREYLKELDGSLKLIPITYDYMFKGIFMNDLDLLKKFIISQLEFNEILDTNLTKEKCRIKLLNNELPKKR